MALFLTPAPVEGAGADRPRVALSVSPAHLELEPPGSRTVRVRNDGTGRLAIDVVPRDAGVRAGAGWLRIRPAHLVLGAGQSSLLTLRATRPQRAEPGDHPTLVLLTTRLQQAQSRLDVHLRVGVRVELVVPGRVVRDVRLGGVRVQRRRGAWVVSVSVANRGNVTVRLRGRVQADLLRRGRHVAHDRPAAQRALRPGARSAVVLRCNGRVRGKVVLTVRLGFGPGVPSVVRRYRIHLSGGFG
jgi:hypothetical protein